MGVSAAQGADGAELRAGRAAQEADAAIREGFVGFGSDAAVWGVCKKPAVGVAAGEKGFIDSLRDRCVEGVVEKDGGVRLGEGDNSGEIGENAAF